MKKIHVMVLFCFVGSWLLAGDISPEVRLRADSILRQMTLKEKIEYIGGVRMTFPGIRPVERLGLPFFKMSDGPQGIRNETKSTLYPCGILSASTWNKELVRKLGVSLGQDARARGVHILLGPGVNIYRSPLCGRNFEYFGEDPYLTGETAAAYIEGVQSQGVIATVKHFAANNQEWDRFNVSSDVDERTLHEIYLPPFEKAVKRARVGAVMNSYNLLNGVHTSENKELNIDILRTQWGFQGILMSDWWSSVYASLGAANGGLDLEMPKGLFFNEKKMLPLIRNGLVSEQTIDDKVRHMLETVIAFGFLDRPQQDTRIPLNNPVSDQVALELAREGMVLLKNEDGILPLKKREKVLILGPNADVCATGGGSGFVTPYAAVTVVAGMKELAGNKKTVQYEDILSEVDFQSSGEFFTGNISGEKGFRVSYFNDELLCGIPVSESTAPSINFDWKTGAPVDGVNPDHFSARWTTIYRPQKDVLVNFRLSGESGCRMLVDGKEFISDWVKHGPRGRENSFRAEAGKEYAIVVEYYHMTGPAHIKLKCDQVDLSDASWIESLRQNDKVVLCIGFNSNIEGEGRDRPFAIPVWQEELVNFVAGINKNTVVVLNAGGGVDFAAWENNAQAILMAWYAGQAGGRAVAEVLTGKISPSGKLPISIEREWKDNPASDSYYADDPDAVYKRVSYKEGVFTGYRGYDHFGKEPRFPFGFGLSYTSFKYNNFHVGKTADRTYMVTFDISNTGKYDASEIVQIYVGFPESSVAMPPRMLKAYDKVFVKKGETRKVSISLDEEAFRKYDVEVHDFVPEKGPVEIMVGRSSRDIQWKETIDVL